MNNILKILLLFFFTANTLFAVTVNTSKQRYAKDESISVTVSGLAGNEDDWLGIFYAFDENQKRHVVSKLETKGKKEGIFIFPGLSDTDQYEVRAFLNGSFNEEDYHPFEVRKYKKPKGVIINEVLASNAHSNIDPDFSKFSDWIELYNNSKKSVDLSGYKLSDKISEAKWTIPKGTVMPARGYMIFWADDKDISLQEHHTNFKLKDKGEAVALFDAEGRLIHSLEFGQQVADISCTNNAGTLGYMYPTLRSKNRKIFSLPTKSAPVQVSKNGGFYSDSITVSIKAEKGAEIYYSTNGSYPTVGSIRYVDPIRIDKTTVLRAMSVEKGKFQSTGVSHTYFMNETATVPVVSITTDEDYLWDPMIGIYIEGINGIPKVCGAEGNANYMQDWKRPANIEYFDKNKKLGFSQEVDISISGSCTRELAQKSLSIKANDKYGKKNIQYKLFAEKDINEFRSIKLRNSGQDWWKTMFRDAMEQQLIKDDLNIDYQAYEPSIVFINGEYWGIHNIREKKNEDYLANNYPGLDPDKVDILYANQTIKEGKADDYAELINYIQNNPLADDLHYDYVANKIDIDNYIDYHIAQIYFANLDWPANNIRYWKEQKEGEKWRWMMDDQDEGFNLYDEGSEADDLQNFGINHNTLAFATAENSENWRNEAWSTFLLRSLLENETFKNNFVSRYNELLNSTFKPANVIRLITKMKMIIEPEMQRHIDTWGDAGPDYSNLNDWNYYVDIMKEFAEKRPKFAKDHLDQMFP